MANLTHVEVGVFDPRRFESVLAPDRYALFLEGLELGRALFEGRVIWNVNSTARGGGVAEMLRSLLAYAQGAEVDARWVVIEGDPEFFRITKRIHNHLHGSPGDGGGLGPAEHEIYSAALRPNAAALSEIVKADDVVILHDPQTAGLVEAMKDVAGTVVWRCHVGLDIPNDIARNAWDFLDDHVINADAHIFSRQDFVWEGLHPEKTVIIPPSIDAFSPKNQVLDDATVRAILSATGFSDSSTQTDPAYTTQDGSRATVARRTTFSGAGSPPGERARMVTQVSRWDALKDPIGLIKAFAEYVAPRTDAHLVVAGPAVEAVSDDPEGAEVLEDARRCWETLPEAVKARVHLACLPMEDGDENAAIVNALQRRSDVVVQKSIAEGFGLTVSEAMWKARPVVASRIGGIQDQIVDNISGILVDPLDYEAFGDAVVELLRDPKRAEGMGDAAQARVRDEFLGPRHLLQYLMLLQALLGQASR